MNTILVIEDDPAMRQMVVEVLRISGYSTLEAEDGRQGVQQARGENPDLILCDLDMPYLDGSGVLTALREDHRTATIPFIFMTGRGDKDSQRAGMSLGADDYLAKPFAINDLLTAVRTRLRKSQMVREAAEKQLAELRTSLSATLPHELLTPLTAILGCAELLRTEAPTLNSGEVESIASTVQQAAERLRRLIQNYLLYARIEILTFDKEGQAALCRIITSSAAEVIEGVVRNAAEKAGRTKDLLLDLIDSPVSMGEDSLGKLVDELIDNALKFSIAGQPVSVSAFPEDTHLLVRVRDQGRGMTSEQVDQISAFTQFDRERFEQQGMGLGLAIARRLAEMHRGTLSIWSVPNEGTTVEVWLPTTPPPERGCPHP